MITFTLLDKQQKEQWLPKMFDLFYENMHTIAPSSLTYEQEKAQWMANVSPALEKDPRKVILCLDGGAFIGYVQYYTNGGLLMVEEMQMVRASQRSTLFYSLCKYFAKVLPEGIVTVEAYAHKSNLHSQTIMGKLGMTQIDEEGPFVHLRGPAEKMYRLFK